MLVKFTSTETGTMVMFADLAATLLRAAGKECTADGVFTQEEMLPAAARLRDAVAAAGQAPAEDEEGKEGKPVSVAFSARAWPLINMLEQTARGKKKPHIVWHAPSDF